MFSTLYDTYFSFSMHFKMSCAISFNLDQSKILSSGNGLKAISPFPTAFSILKDGPSDLWKIILQKY